MCIDNIIPCICHVPWCVLCNFDSIYSAQHSILLTISKEARDVSVTYLDRPESEAAVIVCDLAPVLCVTCRGSVQRGRLPSHFGPGQHLGCGVYSQLARHAPVAGFR